MQSSQHILATQLPTSPNLAIKFNNLNLSVSSRQASAIKFIPIAVYRSYSVQTSLNNLISSLSRKAQHSAFLSPTRIQHIDPTKSFFYRGKTF